eukprot:3902634-Prymnesium_polylepis.1
MTVATTVSSAGRASTEQRCDQEVVPQKVFHNPRRPPVEHLHLERAPTRILSSKIATFIAHATEVIG